MGEFDSTTISIQDLQRGNMRDVLADADVIIAVDENTAEEEVVAGREEWEKLSPSGAEGLSVVRVELDMEADDVEWLSDLAERIKGGDMSDDDAVHDDDELG